MKVQDTDLLLMQIKNMILNKPVAKEAKCQSEDLADLQEAIFHLSDCMFECNDFIKKLSMGNLEAVPPGRHNFLAANLKELHAGLKHITWQANQVAKGDYKQKVSFLGEFSDSFNQMITQLEERERKLRDQAAALANSMNLMVSIVDTLQDLVVVTEEATGEILYSNQSAKEQFYDMEKKKYICGSQTCELMDYLRSCINVRGESQFEFTCASSGKTLSTKTLFIQWNEKRAYVHFISDITCEKVEKEQLESLAFKDELTGLYNRRYCMQQLSRLILDKQEFSVCLIDLDGLKAVNDTLGHLIGDEYITKVTNAMIQMRRSTDTMCRVGGDEFIIIFPNCTEDIVKERMVGLDKMIASFKEEYHMSISYGIIYVSNSMKLLPETILERVDERMYIAKKIKKQSAFSQSATLSQLLI